jgi:polyisoprenoid-binding protein YceI
MTDTLTIPTTGTYTVDPVHSSVSFIARHLVGARVRGSFQDFTGTITIADPPEASTVEAVVQGASITTGQDQRDAHLRSSDFLDLEHHPTLVLKSTSLRRDTDGEFTLMADLTIRGVTRSVPFTLEYLGTGPGMVPRSEVAAFSASADIDRRDFGVSFSGVLDNGGLVVSNKVRIELDVEAHRVEEAAA